MNKFQAAILVYALAMIVMGLQAFFFPEHEASKASLIAGGGVGLLEIFFAALSKTHPRVGYIGAAVVALVPLGRFIPHLMKDGQLVVYPSLVGLVLSAGLALYLVGGHMMSKRKSAAPAPPDPPA